MSKIKDLFFDTEWYVGIRKHESGLFYNPEKSLPIRVNLLKNTFRYWCADPFIFDYHGKTYVFMEAFDKIKQRGCIGYRIINNNRPSRLHICLKNRFHFSYPFIFKNNEQIFLMPECYQSRKLSLYKAVDFPKKWEKHDDLLVDTSLCDSNIVAKEGKRYLLTTELKGIPFRYDNLILYYEEGGKWYRGEKNPIVADSGCSRNGGAIVFENNKLFRPSQNCANFYGESIRFREILSISKDNYEEKDWFELCISNIRVNNCKNTFDGIHTYNTNGEYDVVDLQKTSTFQFASFLGLLYRKIHRILSIERKE